MRNLVFLLIFTTILWTDLASVQREELNQGRLLEDEERVEDALQFYSALYQQYPRDPRVFHALKTVYFELERYDEFVALIDKAYDENAMPEHALALGEANLKMGRIEDSRQWFIQFLKKDDSEASFYKVASIYTSVGMLEEAAKTYEEARENFGNDLLFTKEIALLYNETDLERSLREGIKLYLATREDRVWVERMFKQQVKRGNHTAVLKVIREEMSFHKDEKTLHILLGDILVELNDYESALEEYRLSEESRALLWLAKECEEEGKFTLAVRAYEDYLRKNPNSVEAHIGIGNCFSAISDYQKAEQFYERTVGVAEGNDALEVQYRLAEIKTLHGDLVGARRHYRKIVEASPSSATEAIFRIIDSYMREGKFEEAETECEDALKHDVTRAHYLLGEIRYYRGDFSKAREYHRRVTNHNPNSVWVNDSMERLILLTIPDEELKIYARAEASLLQQKYDEAIKISKEILKETPSSEISPYAIFLIARAYEKRHEPTVAIEGYRDVIDNYPESYLCPHAQYRIGFLYLTELKDIENARRELETALFKYPKSVIAEKIRNELSDLE